MYTALTTRKLLLAAPPHASFPLIADAPPHLLSSILMAVHPEQTPDGMQSINMPSLDKLPCFFLDLQARPLSRRRLCSAAPVFPWLSPLIPLCGRHRFLALSSYDDQTLGLDIKTMTSSIALNTLTSLSLPRSYVDDRKYLFCKMH